MNMFLGIIINFLLLFILFRIFHLNEDYEYPCFSHCFFQNSDFFEEAIPPFKLSEYFERMEKVHISMLEDRKPIDWTITLWLGLNGLKISEDGSFKWITRGNKNFDLKPDVWTMCNISFPHHSFLSMQNANLSQQSYYSWQMAQMAESIPSCQIQLAQQAQMQNMINCLDFTCAEQMRTKIGW